MSAALDRLDAVACSAWVLAPELTVDQWADQHRMLMAGHSHMPGPWRTDATPYLREIMRDLSVQSPVERVVLMKGSRIGATEVGTNWIGYAIEHDPANMLIYQPTGDLAKAMSQGRLDSMIDTTPSLQHLVAGRQSRENKNTTFFKAFAGGELRLRGANAPTGMRMFGAKRLFGDELDAWPGEVGSKENPEGDPRTLAETRTSEYEGRGRKMFYASTPTQKGFSRIEALYLASDRRRYFVPCVHCGHFDWIQWRPGGWTGSDGDHHTITRQDEDRPETSCLRCSACRELMPESAKYELLLAGEWRSTRDEARDGPADGSHGYHLSGLYSPWRSWAASATELREAKQDPLKLKVWVNHVLAETWEESGTSVKPMDILSRARREVWPEADVPNGVGVLVMSVDVQGNRLELAVIGFGAGEESWLIRFEQLMGDPGTPALWQQLDAVRRQPFGHESGQAMRVECTVIDLQGGFAEQVHVYAQEHRAERVYGVFGTNVRGRPLVDRPSLRNRKGNAVYPLGVDVGKDTVTSRLREVLEPGPGYFHLPPDVDEEYVLQLGGEVARRKYVRGAGWVREWVKIRDRNEALDLNVYALAALHILGPSFIRGLGERAEAFAKKVEVGPASAPRPVLRRPTPGGFVNRWRR